MTIRSLLNTVGVLSIAVLSSGLAFGQAVSQITGVTRDQSGAVVPGVEVTAIKTDTGARRAAVTGDTGEFVIPNLLIGPYRLEASKAGFRTYVQNGIDLQVDSSPNIPITLGVGAVTETVEVEANAALVETQKLGVGTVMETQRILDLPLNGRTPTDLIALTGAAVQTGVSVSWSMQTGVTYSVAGGASFGMFYALDGSPHMNMYDSTNLPLPFPDALQEFKVETSAQNANSGMHSGAQVNSVTKSGTNAFHGDLFEFFRNGDLNARNFFSAKQDTLKRNQFGGVIGGPIKKNKIFFFAGYQGTTLRSSAAPTTAFVPTTQMLSGDFSTFASAACQGHNVTLAAPFTTINGLPNQIPQSQISPVALKIASFLPQTSNPCGQYLSVIDTSQYYWQLPFRLDYQVNDKQSIFFRYIATKQNQVLPYTLTPNNLLASSCISCNSADDLAQSATVGHTWLISGTKVNSIRASINRIGMLHDGARYFGPTDVGIDAFTYLPKVMQLAITGGPTIGSGVAEYVWNAHTFGTINDDFSLIHGAHQFSFGASETRALALDLANVRSIGNYTINGQTTGLGLADFMAGDLSQMRQSIPNDLDVRQWYFGAYAQDTWKATSRLTINLGLRWEPFFPMQVGDGRIYTFDLGRFYSGTESKIWTNAPPGFYYPGDPGFNGHAGINGSWKNFEPRVGIAFDPFGDGKTAFRAGAGINYDFINLQSYQNEDNVAPFAGDTTVLGPVPIAAPWSTTPGGDPFPYNSTPPLGKFPVGAVYDPVEPYFKTTEVYSWNAALQRQFTPRLFASISYVGSNTIHLPDNVELNPGVYIPGTCAAGQYGLTVAGPCSNTANVNSRRVLNLANPVAAASISNLTAYDSGATANYNGMILNENWRATEGVNVIANYTWSHCIGLANNGTTTPNPGTNYVHLNDRNLDMGNCSQDRRNLFNLTVVARTPKFNNRAVNLVASGWSVSAIYRYSSGAPLTIGSGLDQALVGFNAANPSGERPNQILADTASLYQGAACANLAPCVSWLNSAAFAQPALGTFGNMGVYNILGPKFFQFDMAAVREFRVRERENLQFRVEAFNVFNNVRFMNPGTTLSAASTFGEITAAQDPRIMQLAMKFTF
ncbi:MAG TPA: carboxypeptidase regulatory-like domain-containing protein [Bryobacteraceae bacterium]|nr:carboxypeptidase regulatory-like domain-containing protein [Bryobacteraceae bacterium]